MDIYLALIPSPLVLIKDIALFVFGTCGGFIQENMLLEFIGCS